MDTHNQKHESIVGVINALARIVAIITLAITLIAAGFAACALPPASTALLAQAFSNDIDSPFTKDELVEAALATRAYTVADNDAQALQATIARINQQAALDGRAGSGAPDLAGVPQADDLFDMPALEQATAHADERYVLTPDAISHLDDVYRVITAATPWLIIAAILAVASVAHVGVRCGKRALGATLAAAGAIVLGIFAALAGWVALDFNGFFAAFHGLFFAEGTWTFSWDSLLICMYPPEFWMGMGGIWLATTVAGCLICLIIGILLRKRS